MTRRTRLSLILSAGLLLAGILTWRGCISRPAFNPEAIAVAECRMWQAYYARNDVGLGLQLVKLLRQQFGLSFLAAKEIGERLARAAMTFKGESSNYESVIPDLTTAYTLIQKHSGRPFDPGAAARAELAWWVARRTPGQNAPEQVGALIGELYAVLYGRRLPEFANAGLLRAQAANLRDTHPNNPDWAEIQRLLTESYRSIAAGMNPAADP